MTWYPIAYLPPQIETTPGVPYSGGVLKAYAAGTNTNIPMATDYTGVTTAASMALNAAGYPSQGGAVVIPHLSQNYKLALYPTQAAANLDSGAVWTVDNVQIAAASNSPFVQYFDGDGVNVTFTLSQNFGTDENILMVFADRAIYNYTSNSDFATDTIWTKGAGWTIGSGVATAAGAISTAISQNANSPIIQGQTYTVEFTVTASAGTLTPSVGGNAGTTRGAGTWRENIVAGATQAIAFTGVAFTGTLDNASVKSTGVAARIINRPDEYTLVGNQLTLSNIPPAGTKNVIVFAPSLLLGAANNAAAAAATSETNALGYANTASAAATSALASYDSFDDRYLGAKTSDPTLDNDGNALLTGALYWNTPSAVMKVWNGSAWSVSYVPVTGTLLAANNLSDVAVAATARTNLGAAASGANSDITALTGLSAPLSFAQDFRLTLASGVPVTTSDVTGATTIYCTPRTGNNISLFVGGKWVTRTSAEFSVGLGTVSNDRVYDVFCYDNAGVPTLEIATWANNAARATGLGVSSGVLVKAGDATRRYMGSFLTTSTTTTEDSVLFRGLYNYYHRVRKPLIRGETTANWTYTTATIRQANGNTANRVVTVQGVAEDPIELRVSCRVANSTANVGVQVGIGMDSTTSYPNNIIVEESYSPASNVNTTCAARYNEVPPIGKHAWNWLEYSIATGTTTWAYAVLNGTNGAGILGSVGV